MTIARVPLRPYLFAWLPFVPVYALAVRFSGAGWVDAALSAVTTVGLAALLGLGVARWRPPSDVPWRRAAIRHAFLSVTYSALWTAFIAAELALGAPAERWAGFLENAIRWQFVTGLLLYALLVAAFTSLDRLAALRAQEQRAARAEADRVRAELQALRAQLNPHFLFNTLHSITALVRSDAARAEGALEQLAACLRHVLAVNAAGTEEVALGDELGFVRDYLALERLRHGNRLRVIEEIDPDVLDAPVLAFLLQPLVENAIRHGMAPLTRPVTIRLSARAVDDDLLLEVADDGAGSTGSTRDGGIGLRALRQRLQARHDGAATLQVTTAPGEGFRVHLTLPLTATTRPPVVLR